MLLADNVCPKVLDFLLNHGKQVYVFQLSKTEENSLAFTDVALVNARLFSFVSSGKTNSLF